jgi:RimJ/RimL family protein N-acetyltransferase
MKPGDTILTERLILRGWNTNTDGEIFHRLNSDEQIMRFFPNRRSRAESDELLEKLVGLAKDDGYGWSAFCRRDTGQVIGWGGLGRVPDDFPVGPATEVGWRLIPEEWGKGLASEAGSACLDYAFETLGLSEVISFAVHDNHASTAVMKRIGMTARPSADFDHPRVPETKPDLIRHVVHAITRDEWQRARATDPLSRR